VPAHPWEGGEAKFTVAAQRLPAEHQRRCHRQLRGGQLVREGVLLVDLRIAPAAGR